MRVLQLIGMVKGHDCCRSIAIRQLAATPRTGRQHITNAYSNSNSAQLPTLGVSRNVVVLSFYNGLLGLNQLSPSTWSPIVPGSVPKLPEGSIIPAKTGKS